MEQFDDCQITGIANKKACVLIPNNCRLLLIGNADRLDLIGLDATFTSDHRLNRVPNLIGIVLHPTSLRKNLSEFRSLSLTVVFFY